MPKLRSLAEAVSELVRDGMTIYVGGFSHAIAFAAAHELIRQGFRDLVLARATPDLAYDQMVAAGCARRLIFSWAGNPGLGTLTSIRRAIERGELEIEEYTHFGMMASLHAGATGLTFYPLPPGSGADLALANPEIRTVRCPYTGIDYASVPALRPDVAFIHAQRGDLDGNVQMWGIVGDQREAALAARAVVACVEEIVSGDVVRADPNRTVIPALVTTSIVHEPWGAHPSYVQGYYDRDDDFYRWWNSIANDPGAVESYLEEWVFGVRDRSEYIARSTQDLDSLRAIPALAEPVSYGTR